MIILLLINNNCPFGDGHPSRERDQLVYNCCCHKEKLEWSVVVMHIHRFSDGMVRGRGMRELMENVSHAEEGRSYLSKRS